MKAVNLIPSEQRKGGAVGRRSQGAAFAVLGLLAGVVLLIFLYGMAKHQVESRKSEAAALTTRAQQVQAQAAQLSSYTSFMQMREQRLQEISQLINSRFDWSSAMGELSRVLPSDVALSSLQGSVGAQTGTVAASKSSSSSPSSSSAPATATAASSGSGSVTSATPAGATPTFTLQGCAVNQTVVAQTLVRLRLISGVSNVTLQSSTKSSSGGGAGGGSCPSGDPVFSVNVTFEALPSPPATSVEALESTASDTKSSAGANTSAGASTSTTRARVVSSGAKGTSR